MELPLRCTAGVAAALALAGGLWFLHQSTLYTLYFVSGWLLLTAVLLDLYWRWDRSALSPQPAGWIGAHAGLAVAAAALFLVHLEFRLPTGWLECALVLLFLGLFLSGLVGLLIRLGLRFGVIDAALHGPRLARRWVLVHVPLEASLITLALIHGTLAHGHGAIAHVLLGR